MDQKRTAPYYDYCHYMKRNYRNTSIVGAMMLNDLNWQTLESMLVLNKKNHCHCQTLATRRKSRRLTMMYKIHTNLVGHERDPFHIEKTQKHIQRRSHDAQRS